jgi:hypothetical protein
MIDFHLALRPSGWPEETADILMSTQLSSTDRHSLGEAKAALCSASTYISFSCSAVQLAGEEQPASSLQLAGEEQPASSLQLAGEEQPASSLQLVGAEQPASSLQLVGAPIEWKLPRSLIAAVERAYAYLCTAFCRLL